MNTDEQTQLLRWARQAIEQAVCGEKPRPVPQVELTNYHCAPHAAFVTLKKFGELRGCIGEMDFGRPLWKNVIDAAVASALDDSRFTPVLPEELPELRLEISVLEPPVDLPRFADFDAQRHGIIVQRGLCRALLLPKVAQEYGWNAEQVLECVCRKAGLPAEAWRDPETRFQVFTAIDFGEVERTD
jgi:AmmeMemoRadiSam system protein A